MTEDTGRATRHPVEADGTGAIDAAADPATDPGMAPVVVDDDRTELLPTVESPPTAPVRVPPRKEQVLKHSRSGGLWTGLILSALVLLFLLIFILQNLAEVQINFLWMTGSLPVGVAMLLAAIAGLLLVAIPGGLRIMQLRRAARRSLR